MKGEDLVGGIAPAWAKDAEGRDVPTRYVVNGATITQVVEHDNSFAYPIIAVRNDVRPKYNGKPVYMMELSAWGQAVYRGSLTLGIAGLVVTTLTYQVMTNEGWAEVIKRQPKANTTSVKQQYVCHVRDRIPSLRFGMALGS